MTQNFSKPWHANVVDTLLENQYFSVLLQHVIVPDGTNRTYYTLDFPRPAVGIVARRGTDILLINQYRFIVDEFVWAIPSGGAGKGETLEAAAARELKEETGYRAGSLKLLLDCYASYGCSNQRFVIFLAENLVQTCDEPDANEVISSRWFTREEVLALIHSNGITDNLSLSPLLLVMLRDSTAECNLQQV